MDRRSRRNHPDYRLSSMDVDEQYSEETKQDENEAPVGNAGAGVAPRSVTPPQHNRPESPQTPPKHYESKEERKDGDYNRREFIRLHAVLDVHDTKAIWCEARIEEVDIPNHRVFVHYAHWTSKWDEWIDMESPRLQPRGSHIWLPGRPIRRGHMLDVFDPHPHVNRYLEAVVIGERVDTILVHYKGYASSCDDWIQRNDPRIQPWCSHTRARQPYKPRNQTYWATNERKSQFTGSTDPRFVHYLTALRALGLSVEAMGGDGNCLFRSVAHQVYGSQDVHAVTRSAAARYMRANASWFSNFVVGDPSQFDAYVDHIATNAVWGDDPEIQALCEIYDRPAEIWAYDPTEGAKRLRVFHSSRADTRPPIRLSYYGGGHYDSVVGADWEANLLRSPPGEREDRVIALSQCTDGAHPSGGAATPEELAMLAALEASRNAYDEADASVDVALLLSLGMDSAVPPTMPLEETIVSQVMHETAVDEAQLALLEQMQRQTEEEQLKAAMEVSKADAVDSDIAAAIELSMTDAAPVVATAADQMYNAALEMTEEEQIEYCITGVLPARFQMHDVGHATAPTAADEDALLAAAIAASLEQHHQ